MKNCSLFCTLLKRFLFRNFGKSSLTMSWVSVTNSRLLWTISSIPMRTNGPPLSKVREEPSVGIEDVNFCFIDPTKRSQFRQFVNTPEQRPQAEIITERGQHRPANWPKSYPPIQLTPDQFNTGKEHWSWVTVAKKSDMLAIDTGVTSVAVKYGDTQLAVFHVPRRGYYATQQMYAISLITSMECFLTVCINRCPHRR